MLRFFRAAVTTSILVAVVATKLVQADTLCSLPPLTYTKAKIAYPASAFAIEALERYEVATWYSNHTENGDYAKTAADLVAFCPEDTRISIVIYGLPNQDCAAKELVASSTVTSAFDYVVFLNTLISAIGNRKVLYILEPDAIGRLVDTTGCADHLTHLQTAVVLLSQNKNAETYLDVGYWTLQQSATSTAVAAIVKQLASIGSNVKGIALNTCNYQSISTLATLCSNFQGAVDATNLHCIFDTSRSYRGGPASNEWCNVKSAGIGALPTSKTGISNVDYFIWAKPPGESDGTCDGRTPDSMHGPKAGIFFDEMFQSLWNQGIMVAEKGYAIIDGTVRSTMEEHHSHKKEMGHEADKYLHTSLSPNAIAIDSTHSTSITTRQSSGTQTNDQNQLKAKDSSPTSAKSEQISTERSGSHRMGTFGVVVVIVLAAVVLLGVIVGVCHHHKKVLNEAKTPAAPLPTRIVNFQPRPAALVQGSNIV
ncbi:hypothetical protein KXD40_007663 [Peronospora effusa]|uniref:Glycoside hydrolase n=1 Tax=Peronospora effusa TaxID=542832 RepID=A0A3M6VQW2_9STRA|nr:hypothetical protein DD238_003338 [Peronospora effusa]UIZ23641.1 hypothetical protein KXD40_007663 [Peronospora effusa]CAI5707375.1 unnamed protein product [Peronospora effusa]